MLVGEGGGEHRYQARPIRGMKFKFLNPQNDPKDGGGGGGGLKCIGAHLVYRSQFMTLTTY